MYTVFRLIKHRRDFGRVVSGAHSALTTSRFVRLAALSFSYLLIGLPLCIYTTLSNIASSQAYFDYSWDYLHSVVSSLRYFLRPSKTHMLLISGTCILYSTIRTRRYRTRWGCQSGRM